MLFDLFHDAGITERNTLLKLLGTPEEMKEECDKWESWTYELGLQNGHYTFLNIGLKDGRPRSMRILQKYLDVVPQMMPEWTVKNEQWDELAEEYNRNFFIVGMPVKVNMYFSGKAEESNVLEPDGTIERVHCSEPFQFQYTPDGSKVRRFRMTYENATGTNGITKWQETDLRTDPRCLVSIRDYKNRFPSGCFVKFSSADWKADGPGPRRGIGRHSMIESLTRSYPLIGMSREKITALLGKGTKHESTMSEEEADPLIHDVEAYPLIFPFCGNSGYSVFELSYRQNRVVAYRIVNRNGMGGSSLESGPLFNLDEK